MPFTPLVARMVARVGDRQAASPRCPPYPLQANQTARNFAAPAIAGRASSRRPAATYRQPKARMAACPAATTYAHAPLLPPFPLAHLLTS
jgi:hypothetical protein